MSCWFGLSFNFGCAVLADGGIFLPSCPAEEEFEEEEAEEEEDEEEERGSRLRELKCPRPKPRFTESLDFPQICCFPTRESQGPRALHRAFTKPP